MTCTLGLRTFECDELVVAPECGDIILPYGTDNDLVAIVKDGDEKAIPINTDTITLTVKDGRGGTLIFAKVNAPGSHANPAQGETVFSVSSADISSADPYAVTVWRYEVRRQTSGGAVFSHVSGRFIIEPTI
jgi:hypothetical protein